MPVPATSASRSVHVPSVTPSASPSREQSVAPSRDTLSMANLSSIIDSLRSVCNRIIRYLKSFFDYFFKSSATPEKTTTTAPQDHLPSEKQIAEIADRDRFIWFGKTEAENPLTVFLSNDYRCKIELWMKEFRCATAAYNAGKNYPDTRNLRSRGRAAMNWVLATKFTQNEDLKKLLLATGNAYIVYYSAQAEDYWGINSTTKFGNNHLGETLMVVRAHLGGAGIQPRPKEFEQFISSKG
jgi:hypothetical protein